MAVYAKEPALLRHLCHPGKVAQARTNSISVWKAIYKPALSGMTLLIRLGEGWGRERGSFHKTIDMHFQKWCFSFTLCSKRLSNKAEIWVSLQQEKKALSMLSAGPKAQTFYRVVLLPHVPEHANKAQTLYSLNPRKGKSFSTKASTSNLNETTSFLHYHTHP